VGGDGSANALEFELPNRLHGDGFFDRHQNARANQNLTGLSFVAKPRCDVRHRPDGGVVEASLETNRAERGISVYRSQSRGPADSTSQSMRRSPPAFLVPSAPPVALGCRPEWDRSRAGHGGRAAAPRARPSPFRPGHGHFWGAAGPSTGGRPSAAAASAASEIDRHPTAPHSLVSSLAAARRPGSSSK
jgi:hypothetical protein